MTSGQRFDLFCEQTYSLTCRFVGGINLPFCLSSRSIPIEVLSFVLSGKEKLSSSLLGFSGRENQQKFNDMYTWERKFVKIVEALTLTLSSALKTKEDVVGRGLELQRRRGRQLTGRGKSKHWANKCLLGRDSGTQRGISANRLCWIPPTLHT